MVSPRRIADVSRPMPGVDERNSLLRASALFSVLTRSELSYAAEHSVARRFRRGQPIVHRNKVSTGMHSVVEGFAKLGMASDDGGGEVIYSVRGAGDWFGEMAVIDGMLEPFSAIAMGPAMVMTVQRSAVLELVERNKRLGLALTRLLAADAREQYRRVEEMQLYDLSTRLARTLLRLSTHHRTERDGHALRVALPLTQSDLAAMLGATRVRVNLLLGVYRDAGIIRLDRTGIAILLPEQLRARARVS